MPDFRVSSDRYSEFEGLPEGFDYENFFEEIEKYSIDELHQEFKNKLKRKSKEENESWSDLDSLARKIALKTLHSSEEREFPVDLDEVIKTLEQCFGIDFKIKETDFGGSNCATMVPGEESLSIFYDSSDSKGRRYILAHEMGHALAFDFQDTGYKDIPKKLHNESSMKRISGETKKEFISDSFTFEILLPYSNRFSQLYGSIDPGLEEMENLRKEASVGFTIFRRRLIDELSYFHNSCLMEVKEDDEEFVLDYDFEDRSLRYRFGPYSKGRSFDMKVEDIIKKINEWSEELSELEDEEVMTIPFGGYKLQATSYEDRNLCLVTGK